jgi:hypothetical protein
LEYWEGNVGIHYIALQGWKLKGDADAQIVLNSLVQLMQDNSTSHAFVVLGLLRIMTRSTAHPLLLLKNSQVSSPVSSMLS